MKNNKKTQDKIVDPALRMVAWTKSNKALWRKLRNLGVDVLRNQAKHDAFDAYKDGALVMTDFIYELFRAGYDISITRSKP
jgi:hypothetical protein